MELLHDKFPHLTPIFCFIGLIFEYLLDKYDKDHKLAPAPGTKDRYPIQYWLHYSEGTITLG